MESLLNIERDLTQLLYLEQGCRAGENAERCVGCQDRDEKLALGVQGLQ